MLREIHKNSVQVTDIKLEIIESKALQASGRPPLLFIHGAYAAAWCWQVHYLAYFAQRGYHGFAVSLRGHGLSEGRSGLAATSVHEYAEDVAQAIRLIEMQTGRRPVLVGHSMGGYLAQMVAREQVLPGLALLATVPPEGLMGSALHLFWQHPQLLWELNLLQNSGVPPRLDKLRELLFSADIVEAELQAYAARFQHESDRALIDMNLPQFDQRPPRGMPPALVLGSHDDKLMPCHLIYSAARALGVRAHMVQGLGHMLMLDAGWQLAAAALAAWLEELP